MHWTEESKKPQSLLTKPENQTLNWRKVAERARRVRQKRRNKPKIGQIRKTRKSQGPLLYEIIWFYQLS